jgi:hypothetical protein
MTRTFSRLMLAVPRAGALVSVVLVLCGLGFAQEVVTARASIPFNFWVQGHGFPAGDYVFDNSLPGSATIHREGSNSSFAVALILYAVPMEKENPRVIFIRRDGKYSLVEIWSVRGRYVVTADFQHRGEVNEQQRQVALTLMDSHEP